MVQQEREFVKGIFEQKRRTDRGLKKLSPDYPGDSIGTQKKRVIILDKPDKGGVGCGNTVRQIMSNH